MKKITHKIISLCLASVLFLGISLFALVYVQINKLTTTDLNEMEKIMYQNFDQQAKNQVFIVKSILKAMIENNPGKSYEELKKEGADIIRKLRYDKEGYFWVDRKDGLNIVLLGSATEGTNRLEQVDVKGNYLIKSIINQAISGNGYSEYWFPKKKGGTPLKKRSFSSYFEPFDWVIGTGNYVEDIDLTIAQNKELLLEENKKIINLILVFVIIVLITSSITAIIIGQKISTPLIVLSKQTSKIADGDLNISIDTTQKSEIGALAISIKNMLSKLQEIIQKTHTGVETLSLSSDEMDSAAEQLSESANENAASTEQISSSMEEMMASINQTNSNSREIMHTSKQLTKDVEIIANSATKNLKAMKKIAEKVNIVNEIANKTDMLAINAAVEAARAGNNGKGFSEIAREIRQLSARSQTASIEIEELASVSVKTAKKTNQALGKSRPNLKKTLELINEITAANFEQTSGVNQINEAILQSVNSTNQNSAASEQIANHARELNKLAKELKDTIKYFSL